MNKNIFKYDDMKRSEHMAVRNNVGWYFWTHQLIEVTGPDVVPFLDYLYTGNIASLAVGRDRYTTMLNEQGEIIDDVVIMRVGEDTYWVSTLYATKADDWWYFHQGDFDVECAKEFWLGFARSVPATVHFVQFAGENSHHILEAAFKGAGRALADAVRIDAAHRDEIPSTKGLLV